LAFDGADFESRDRWPLLTIEKNNVRLKKIHQAPKKTRREQIERRARDAALPSINSQNAGRFTALCGASDEACRADLPGRDHRSDGVAAGEPVDASLACFAGRNFERTEAECGDAWVARSRTKPN
jgi:hypothetical protein